MPTSLPHLRIHDDRTIHSHHVNLLPIRPERWSPPGAGGGAGGVRVGPRCGGLLAVRLEPPRCSLGWCTPTGENPGHRGSPPAILRQTPPSTAGLNRFAERPVNGPGSGNFG